MSYQSTSEFRSEAELIQPVSTTKEIKVPKSVLPKLSASQSAGQNIYNPALDSTETNSVEAEPAMQTESGSSEQFTTPEVDYNAQTPVETDFSKPVDVAKLLSGEEPAVPINQDINNQSASTGEPAYGEEPKPDNIIQLPNMSQEPVMTEAPYIDAVPTMNITSEASQDTTQNFDELGDTIARIEEGLLVMKELLDQAKVSLEKAKGTESEYRKAA